MVAPDFCRRFLVRISRGAPHAVTVPEVGVSMQSGMSSSVVLPPPEGPISKVSSPRRGDRSMPCSAYTSRAPRPSDFVTSFASMTKSLIGCASASGDVRNAGPGLLRGLLLRKVDRPHRRMSVLAAAFRSSHVVGTGTSVVLTRWIHRAAFIGTATRARPCRHAFFMLHFLAGGSAGTDVSFAGRAGCSLGLSRRNERRAEQRRNDESRDCKFGSHQKISVGYSNHSKARACNSVPARGKQFANFISEELVRDCCAIIHYFSKHPSPSDHRICAKRLHQMFVRTIGGIGDVRGPYQESSVLKMRRDDGTADDRA